MATIDISNIGIQFDYSGEELVEIRRCLNMLYSTPAGTVGLDRDFGLDWDFADMPTETAKSMFVVEVIKKTVKYEPRVEVREVKYTQDINGVLRPKVVIGYVGNN